MTKRPDIGALRQRVTLYNTTRVDDGAGGFTRSDPSEDTKIGTFWASVKPVKAKEIIQAEQHVEVVTHEVLVRYNAAFADGQTITHRGRTMYVITLVDPDQKKVWLKLMVRDGGPV